MKTIRAIIAVLFIAVSAMAVFATPFVQAYASGQSLPQCVLRIVQLIYQRKPLNPNKSKRKERKNAV